MDVEKLEQQEAALLQGNEEKVRASPNPNPDPNPNPRTYEEYDRGERRGHTAHDEKRWKPTVREGVVGGGWGGRNCGFFFF